MGVACSLTKSSQESSFWPTFASTLYFVLLSFPHAAVLADPTAHLFLFFSKIKAPFIRTLRLKNVKIREHTKNAPQADTRKGLLFTFNFENGKEDQESIDQIL